MSTLHSTKRKKESCLAKHQLCVNDLKVHISQIMDIELNK